jgi:hypothetical protein
MNIDLQAARCPNAQLQLNKALEMFLDSNDQSLTVASIEPSLLRSIKERIAHFELPITLLDEGVNTRITEFHQSAWLDNFYEEDFEGVEHITTYTLIKPSML